MKLHPLAAQQLTPAGVDVAGTLSQGTFTAANIVNPSCGSSIVALFESMKDGLVYVNVHSAANPTGEVRGQLLTFPNYQ
jgi:hypothetical protein